MCCIREAAVECIRLLLQAFVAAGQPPAAAAVPQQGVAACSPLALAAAALSMLAQLAEASGPPAGAAAVQAVRAEPAAGHVDGGVEEAGSSGKAAAWGVLCRVFASVAAEVSAPQQQRALLRLCLEVPMTCACVLSTFWVAMQYRLQPCCAFAKLLACHARLWCPMWDTLISSCFPSTVRPCLCAG